MTHRRLAMCAVALAGVVGLGVLAGVRLPSDLTAGTPSSAFVSPPLTLRIPARTADPVIPVTVSTRLAPAAAVEIDVDLNHDGQFQGRGELAYAQGKLSTDGPATVRLHGLVSGVYLARARLTTANGQEVVSTVERLTVLPPLANRLPVSFEPNKGQADSDVLFLGRAQNLTAYIRAADTVLVTTPPPPADRKAKREPAQVQRFRLVGADPRALPKGQKKLPGISNYFIGNDPSQWRTNVETYQEVVTEAVYPGIDLVYYGSQGRLEYDFRVAAEADPSVITLECPDVSDLSIDEDGALLLHLPDGEVLRKSAPVPYQEKCGRREGVKGDWVLKGPKQAGYVVTAYDPGRELVIDPLIFSTYYGGAGDDWAFAIAVDAAGNSYVTGWTTSANFPTPAGAYQAAAGYALNPSFDAVVLKLNPAGTAVVYATYLGAPGPIVFGAGANQGAAIAVDGAGNAYIAGMTTSATFPTTAGAIQLVLGGGQDAFVAKLNPTGSALLYSTYLGGPLDEFGTAIVVDGAGNAYLASYTDSNNLPTTAGVFQPAFAGISNDFVAKINPTGTALLYLGSVNK